MADNQNPADSLRDAMAAVQGARSSDVPSVRTARPACPEPRQIADDPDASAGRTLHGARCWHLFAIGKIAEFSALRRRLGRARSDRIIADIVDRAASIRQELKITPSGRSTLEIEGIVHGPAQAQSLLDALDAAMAEAIVVDGEAVMIRMRLAGAVAPVASRDEIGLIEAAETAMARSRGNMGIDLIDLTRPDVAIDRSLLIRELPKAIEAGDLFVQYQPKIHLRHQRIASAEALIRWNHRTRGLILPGEFIAAAEESGGIGPLTVWTLRQVIADQRKLRARGHDFTIFINISGQLLADRGFVDTVREIVIGSDAAIGFEITETSVIRDPDSAITHLKAFAEIGIPLAIDDYGAGLSSLSYLKQLPARELKIDKLFVTQLTSSNRDPLIVRSTIDLAHALDMEVTAEGVESPAALALLSVMGCDMAQGYLISRPIGIDAFITYCDEDRHLEISSNARPGFGNPASFWRRSG